MRAKKATMAFCAGASVKMKDRLKHLYFFSRAAMTGSDLEVVRAEHLALRLAVYQHVYPQPVDWPLIWLTETFSPFVRPSRTVWTPPLRVEAEKVFRPHWLRVDYKEGEFSMTKLLSMAVATKADGVESILVFRLEGTLAGVRLVADAFGFPKAAATGVAFAWRGGDVAAFSLGKVGLCFLDLMAVTTVVLAGDGWQVEAWYDFVRFVERKRFLPDRIVQVPTLGFLGPVSPSS